MPTRCEGSRPTAFSSLSNQHGLVVRSQSLLTHSRKSYSQRAPSCTVQPMIRFAFEFLLQSLQKSFTVPVLLFEFQYVELGYDTKIKN